MEPLLQARWLPGDFIGLWLAGLRRGAAHALQGHLGVRRDVSPVHGGASIATRVVAACEDSDHDGVLGCCFHGCCDSLHFEIFLEPVPAPFTTVSGLLVATKRRCHFVLNAIQVHIAHA